MQSKDEIDSGGFNGWPTSLGPYPEGPSRPRPQKIMFLSKLFFSCTTAFSKFFSKLPIHFPEKWASALKGPILKRRKL